MKRRMRSLKMSSNCLHQSLWDFIIPPLSLSEVIATMSISDNKKKGKGGKRVAPEGVVLK